MLLYLICYCIDKNPTNPAIRNYGICVLSSRHFIAVPTWNYRTINNRNNGWNGSETRQMILFLRHKRIQSATRSLLSVKCTVIIKCKQLILIMAQPKYVLANCLSVRDILTLEKNVNSTMDKNIILQFTVLFFVRLTTLIVNREVINSI